MGETAEHPPSSGETSFKTKFIRHCGTYKRFREALGRDFFAITKPEAKRLYQKRYGRNSKCFCASGKKAKRCCLSGY